MRLSSYSSKLAMLVNVLIITSTLTLTQAANAPIPNKCNAAQYFVDTGTWRKSIPSFTLKGGGTVAFGEVKAITYVIIYGSKEDLGGTLSGLPRTESFYFWTGNTEEF